MKKLALLVLPLLAACQYQWVPELEHSSSDPTRPRVTCFDGVQRVQIGVGNTYEAWNPDQYDLRVVSVVRVSGSSTVNVLSSPQIVPSSSGPIGNWWGTNDVHPYSSTDTWTYSMTWEWLENGSVVAGPFNASTPVTLPGCPAGLP